MEKTHLVRRSAVWYSVVVAAISSYSPEKYKQHIDKLRETDTEFGRRGLFSMYDIINGGYISPSSKLTQVSVSKPHVVLTEVLLMVAIDEQ